MGFFGGSRKKRRSARRTVPDGRCTKRGQSECISNINCMWTKPGKRNSHCRRKTLRNRRLS
jgi:hypothetical protein